VILRPGLVESVDWVKCSYESPYGKIVSNWKLGNGLFMWDISVPPNTTATVYVPASRIEDITESGEKIGKATGVTFLRMDKNRTVLKVDSGSYKFVSKNYKGKQ
jgi:alpha-L-rhamnosidase